MPSLPLLCLVADGSRAADARPDTSLYSPKQLAAKEQVSLTSVYAWVRAGLPVLRQGRGGNIRICYQDYIRWMIECARESFPPEREIPAWAYRFLRAEPPKGVNMPDPKRQGKV